MRYLRLLVESHKQIVYYCKRRRYITLDTIVIYKMEALQAGSSCEGDI